MVRSRTRRRFRTRRRSRTREDTDRQQLSSLVRELQQSFSTSIRNALSPIKNHIYRIMQEEARRILELVKSNKFDEAYSRVIRFLENKISARVNDQVLEIEPEVDQELLTDIVLAAIENVEADLQTGWPWIIYHIITHKKYDPNYCAGAGDSISAIKIIDSGRWLSGNLPKIIAKDILTNPELDLSQTFIHNGYLSITIFEYIILYSGNRKFLQFIMPRLKECNLFHEWFDLGYASYDECIIDQDKLPNRPINVMVYLLDYEEDLDLFKKIYKQLDSSVLLRLKSLNDIQTSVNYRQWRAEL
jgi:hypothetical protein